jgi:hypothetical protein
MLVAAVAFGIASSAEAATSPAGSTVQSIPEACTFVHPTRTSVAVVCEPDASYSLYRVVTTCGIRIGRGGPIFVWIAEGAWAEAGVVSIVDCGNAPGTLSPGEAIEFR